MNELRIFENSEFGSVRTTRRDNEPYFCLSDVCKILEIKNVSDCKSRLKKDGIGITEVMDSLGRKQQATFISESNLYKVIFQSRKESAERFTDWVTSDVLPSIRNNGGYIMGQESLSDDELLEKAVLVAQKKIAERDRIIEQQKQKIEQDKPKTIFADAVSVSETSILVRELAKLIKQNGISIGEKRLYQWMRENGYICQKSTEPTQRAMELGLFERIVRTIDRGSGLPIETITTKVTGKGQIYFINKFLNAEVLA